MERGNALVHLMIEEGHPIIPIYHQGPGNASLDWGGNGVVVEHLTTALTETGAFRQSGLCVSAFYRYASERTLPCRLG